MIHIQVGTTKPSDIAAILDFWANHAENNSRPSDSADALIGLLERDPEALILAIENDEIVGTVIAGWNGWRACLYRLAVREDKRRHGVHTASNLKRIGRDGLRKFSCATNLGEPTNR